MTADAPPNVATSAERLVRDYLDLWNARDLTTIWSRVYAPDASKLPWDEAGMRAALKALEEQGFDRSDYDVLGANELAPDLAEVHIRFTRLTKDGTALPPGPRETLYTVRRLGEGWRITEMRAVG